MASKPVPRGYYHRVCETSSSGDPDYQTLEELLFISGGKRQNFRASKSRGWNSRWRPLPQRLIPSARKLSGFTHHETLPVSWVRPLTEDEMSPPTLNAVDEGTLSPVSRIAIPTIGSLFMLSEPWSFELYLERRNRAFMDKAFDGIPSFPGFTSKRSGDCPGKTLVFPTGTKLRIDRLYIRKGVFDFDSVTLILAKGNCPTFPKLYGRFWVKLHDINRVVCQWDLSTVRRVDNTDLLTQIAAATESVAQP